MSLIQILFVFLSKFLRLIPSIFTYACVHAKLLQFCPTLCDPRDCSPQAPLSMGFSRQEHWSGVPFPSPGDLLDPGIKPTSPALHGWASGKPLTYASSQVFHLWCVCVCVCVCVLKTFHYIFNYHLLKWPKPWNDRYQLHLYTKMRCPSLSRTSRKGYENQFYNPCLFTFSNITELNAEVRRIWKWRLFKRENGLKSASHSTPPFSHTTPMHPWGRVLDAFLPTHIQWKRMHQGHSQNWLSVPGTGGLMVWHLSHASKGKRVWSSFRENIESYSGIKRCPPPADLRDLSLLEAR